MALLEQWQKIAYNEKTDRGELQRFWQRYSFGNVGNMRSFLRTRMRRSRER